MWSLFEDKAVKKQLKKAPKEIVVKYEFWKNVASHDGPKGLRRIPGFKNHSLKGDWKGARSSYLNKQWRVIYYVMAQKLEIIILEVKPHEYRK